MTRSGWTTRPTHRKTRLPKDWPARRAAVLERDGHVCRLRYDGCTIRATDVDHRQRGDDHSLANLQSACRPCHNVKTGREGQAARPSIKREPERHPGLAYDPRRPSHNGSQT